MGRKVTNDFVTTQAVDVADIRLSPAKITARSLGRDPTIPFHTIRPLLLSFHSSLRCAAHKPINLLSHPPPRHTVRLCTWSWLVPPKTAFDQGPNQRLHVTPFTPPSGAYTPQCPLHVPCTILGPVAKPGEGCSSVSHTWKALRQADAEETLPMYTLPAGSPYTFASEVEALTRPHFSAQAFCRPGRLLKRDSQKKTIPTQPLLISDASYPRAIKHL